MYAFKFIVFAVFCLAANTTRPTAANVWHMEQLLQKPFWKELVDEFPNAHIHSYGQRTVSVRFLFFKNRDGNIVNPSNLNKKVCLYYNLLSSFFTYVVMYNLRYIERLEYLHRNSGAQWNLDNHVIDIIRDSYHIYCMMDGALSLVSSMYTGETPENPEFGEGEGGEPRLDRRLQQDLQNLKNVSLWPRSNLYQNLNDIMSRLIELQMKNMFVYHWKAQPEDLGDVLGRVRDVNNLIVPDGDRISSSLSFLNIKQDQFLNDFEAIGFVYYQNTQKTYFMYYEPPQE